jgi:hypothetical protein
VKPKFELGKVVVKLDAANALSRAGQDAEFFLEKHVAGDRGDVDCAINERGLREGTYVRSVYKTLRGADLRVITFFARNTTYLDSTPDEESILTPYQPVD